jgi:hypothetical protein
MATEQAIGIHRPRVADEAEDGKICDGVAGKVALDKIDIVFAGTPLDPVCVSCVAAVALASGCGIFKSSTSQASSESSSKFSSSSSPSDKESAYQRDIRDYTTAYAAQGGDVDRFRHGVGAIAGDHGVTDWEADAGTLVAIRSGVRNAHQTSWPASVKRRWGSSPARSIAVTDCTRVRSGSPSADPSWLWSMFGKGPLSTVRRRRSTSR